jgi:hypothetical protein
MFRNKNFAKFLFLLELKIYIFAGNEEGLFEVKRDSGASEVKIVNKYKITGPRDFHIVMVTSVTQRGEHRPSKRYRYDIYVSVSEFSLP